jgi:hypothetical protein
MLASSHTKSRERERDPGGRGEECPPTHHQVFVESKRQERGRGGFMWENNLENNLEVRKKTRREGEKRQGERRKREDKE